MLLAKQETLTLPEHLVSPPLTGGLCDKFEPHVLPYLFFRDFVYLDYGWVLLYGYKREIFSSRSGLLDLLLRIDVTADSESDSMTDFGIL